MKPTKDIIIDSFRSDSFTHEKILETVNKAINTCINQKQFLIDENATHLFKPEYIELLQKQKQDLLDAKYYLEQKLGK